MKEYDYHQSLYLGRLIQAAMVVKIDGRSCAACPNPFTENDSYIMLHKNGKTYHLDCHFRGETWTDRPANQLAKRPKSKKMPRYDK